MGRLEERIEELRVIARLRDEGHLFCIPFYDRHPKLAKIIPGVIKGILYKITAQTGAGKTQFTKEMFCITPLEFLRQNPELDMKVKIFYFALEESEEDFIDALIVNRLATKFNIRVETTMLKGLQEKYPDKELLDKIEECKEDVNWYLEHIEIIDSVYNPTGIYKYCRDYSERVGTHHWEDKEFMKKGIKEVEKVYSHYTPDDPSEHVIVIVDHLSFMGTETDKKEKRRLTKHESMAKWSTDYCTKQIIKHWGWTVVNVQQQEQSKEKQHFTSSGASVIEKTEPSLDGLANNKELQRDDYVVFSIYSPDKFGFDEYHEYDISRFRDTFRAVKVLKNRVGKANKYIHFLFDGATNRFIELPKVGEDPERLKIAYETADHLLER